MYIRDLFKGYEYTLFGKNAEIKTITAHSRIIGEDCLFFAHNGVNYDGKDNVCDAIKRGAVAVCTSDGKVAEMITGLTSVVLVRDSRHAESYASDRLYPVTDRPKIVGVTGTNGKTSFCHIAKKVFTALGNSSAYTGTLGTDIKGYDKILSNTTPPPSVYRKIIYDARAKGVDYVFSEVSSQGIIQSRTSHVPFHALVFTNLTHDHLDAHGNMEEYFRVKSTVFEENNCFYIINKDDDYGKRLYDSLEGVKISVGEDEYADVIIGNFCRTKDGISFRLTLGEEEINIITSLFGRFNAYNIAFVCAVAYIEGYKPKEIEDAVNSSLSFPVPGRMERYTFGQSHIFVDYAHTPDALENALKTLKEICTGRIITVFGCGGDRDKTKRPEMGRIACRYSDEVILTEDNSRSEDILKIINDIYCACNKDNTKVYPHRKQAIVTAANSLEKGDVLLIAGRGAEEYLYSGSGRTRFSDREFTEYLCRKKNESKL